jgi:putative transposase
VRLLCELYSVSTASFYAWRRRGVCARAREDEALLAQILSIFDSSRATYGSPRIHAALKQRGISVAKKRVCRLMTAAGLQAKAWHPNRNKAAVKRFFGELPNRQLDVTTTAPDQVWVGDITYLKAGSRWMYLAIVLDKHSRRILGWRLGWQKDIRLTIAALNQAVVERRPSPGLIFHSDRGAEYAAYAYRDHLTRLGIVQSMKRPRVITDNAHAESFFKTLKAEVFQKPGIDNEEKISSAIRAYMPRYNETRLHSALGFCSPVDYESLAAQHRSHEL